MHNLKQRQQGSHSERARERLLVCFRKENAYRIYVLETELVTSSEDVTLDENRFANDEDMVAQQRTITCEIEELEEEYTGNNFTDKNKLTHSTLDDDDGNQETNFHAESDDIDIRNEEQSGLDVENIEHSADEVAERPIHYPEV